MLNFNSLKSFRTIKLFFQQVLSGFLDLACQSIYLFYCLYLKNVRVVNMSPEPELSQINRRIYKTYLLCLRTLQCLSARRHPKYRYVLAHNLILLRFSFVFTERGRDSPYFGRSQSETSYVCEKYG